jgi:hypothetical protein
MEYHVLYVVSRKGFEFKFQFENHLAYESRIILIWV